MPLATITGNRSDIAGLADKSELWFKPTIPTADVLSPRRVKAVIADNGDYSIQLHPGPATVTIFNKSVPFVVPADGGTYTLWSRIAATIALPPETTQAKLEAAVTRLVETGATDILTEAVADATYAPQSVVDEVAGKISKSQADNFYAPTVDARVPAANLPSTFRTTDSQPFAADSIWNTPVGSQAAYESSSALVTADFLDNTPVVNDTLNGYGFYLNVARSTDPIGTGSYPGESGTITFTHRMPYDPVISAGTDGSMRVIDGRFVYDYWKTTKVDDLTYTAEFITRTDLLGTGRNAGTRAARFPTSGGLIRSHELAKCYIPHALCISIPAASLKRGFVWPAAAEDAAGVTYAGEVPMGSFFAIPPSVNISTLSLSQEGFALAECLQNYGVYVGDASQSAAISVDGEAAVVMRPALERMRADWAAVFSQLRRVTNIGTTPGGPGVRRVPAGGPVAVRTDYQETVIDVLAARLRATSGSLLTSETCSTDVDPITPTNAGFGGRSMTWTGYPTQYRIAGGAIKRIAAPDGQSRVLFVNPGVHNMRVECTVVTMHASGWIYLVAGATDSSNSYRIAVTSSGAMHIQKTVGGTTVSIDGTGTPNGTVSAGKRIGIMVYGPSIYALVNGEVVAETVDASNQSGTQGGILFQSDTSIAVKEFTIRTVPRLFRKPS